MDRGTADVSNCKNAKCIEGCPVSINIPAFIRRVKEGEIEEAYKIHCQYTSALPATLWTCMSAGDTVRRQVYSRYQG